MKIKSKHGNLLNYFIHDRRDLSPAYVASCEKFLKNLKPQAASAKARQDRIKRFDKALDNLVKQVKAASAKPQASSALKKTQ